MGIKTTVFMGNTKDGKRLLDYEYQIKGKGVDFGGFTSVEVWDLLTLLMKKFPEVDLEKSAEICEHKDESAFVHCFKPQFMDCLTKLSENEIKILCEDWFQLQKEHHLKFYPEDIKKSDDDLRFTLIGREPLLEFLQALQGLGKEAQTKALDVFMFYCT